jgi:NhaP-type Na+/H+ or K+/H+ antiporter
LLAWIFVKAHKLLPTDAPSDVVLTIIEPYCMYWVAEQVHSSGVLAVVAGGVYMSSKSLLFLNSSSRIKGYSVWESFVFILNGIVFLVIGLELPEIVNGLRNQGTPLSTAIGYGVLVTVVLIVSRMISSYAAMFATIIFRPSVAPRTTSNRQRWILPLFLGWTGMRGVVSLAAALSIPVVLESGAAFPHRDLILFVTFVAILLTLLVQGLTLPYFIRRSKLFDELIQTEKEETTKKKVKQALKQHIFEFLQNKYQTEWQGNAGMEKFIKQWEERAQATDDSWMNEKTKVIFLELLESQRQFLTELNKDSSIDEEIIRTQLYQIDLEEERLRIV